MKRALLTAVASLAFVGVASAPASAAGPDVIDVDYSTEDGLWFGTSAGNQPLVGGWVNDEEACVGFSLQRPQCVPLTWS